MPRRRPPSGKVKATIANEDAVNDTKQLKYMFLTTTETNSKRNDQKRRSHVMQNYFRFASDKPRDSNPITTLASGKMSFRLRPNGLERRYPYWYGRKPPHHTEADSTLDHSTLGHQPLMTTSADEAMTSEMKEALLRLSTTPMLIFGDTGVDAYGILPVVLGPLDKFLLGAFHIADKFPYCPINGQSIWSPFALSDPLVLHVTMYIWSWSFQTRVDPQAASFLHPGIIQHKVSAISLINQRLSDSVQVVSDETIAAVAAMTMMEVMVGEREEAADHMNGLRMLVAMRGGFCTFVTDMQLLIQRLLTWADLVYSELYEVSLSFPATGNLDGSRQSFEKSTLLLWLPGLSPDELRIAGVARHECIDLLHATFELCPAEQVQPLRTLSDTERMKRGDLLYPIERRLRTIIHDPSATNTEPSMSNTWRAVALANLMFVHHSLRGNSSGHRQFTVLVPQLQRTLMQMSESLSELAFAPSLLLWVLGVGAVTSSATSSQAWFILRLSKTCKVRGLDWDRFHDLLAGFLWTGSADEERFLNVWHMIETQ